MNAICDDITKALKEYNVKRHIGNNVFRDIAEFIKQNGDSKTKKAEVMI